MNAPIPPAKAASPLRLALSATPRSLPAPPGDGTTLLITGTLAGDTETKGGALVGLAFTPPPTREQLARTNLAHSEKIGPFAYLQASPASGAFRLELSLPFDTTLEQLSFRLWNSPGPLLIRDLDIRRLSSDRPRDILVNISVDVEALPGRADTDRIDRLIYGRFDGGEYGIPAQMRLFRELGIPASFYLEYGQSALYGDAAVARIGREILDAGFDLQMHLHAELLAPPAPKGGTKPSLENLDAAKTRTVLGYAVERHHAITGRAPDVFRAGSFRFNPACVHIGRELGIGAHSNYRADQRANNAFDFRTDFPMRPFIWSNGLFELPITLSPEPLNLHPPEAWWERVMHHVEVNKAWLANVVIHSWSFLHRGAGGMQEWRGPEMIEALRRFVQAAPPGIRFVAIAEVVEALRREEIRMSLCKDPADLVRRG